VLLLGHLKIRIDIMNYKRKIASDANAVSLVIMQEFFLLN